MTREIQNPDVKLRVLEEKWTPVLDYDKKGFKPIEDMTKRKVVAQLLENMAGQRNPRTFLSEAGQIPAPPTAGGTFPSNSNMRGPIPMLMSIARRAIPNIVGFDITGVQPMTAPTQLVIALQSRYDSPAGNEALFNEADTDFSGTGTHAGTNLPISIDGGSTPAPSFTYGTGKTTTQMEQLGSSDGDDWAQMSMSLKGFNVEAKGRALKTRWTHELAEDLMKTCNLDARSELINIATTELVQAVNREIIRAVYVTAQIGAQDCDVPGVYNLNADIDGVTFGDKVKGLLYQIQKESTVIGYNTRRGHGNVAIVSGRVYDAIALSGMLDQTGLARGTGTMLEVDISQNIFAGSLFNGRIKVYVDPFVPYGHDYVVVGYKGASVFDAGMFYCPYSPLQMFEVMDSEQLQPTIGFKTRYGLSASPFALSSGAITGALTADLNVYYRKFLVFGLDTAAA